MAKFLVQAVARQGYDGLFRAGVKWFSSGPTEVEVVDSDEDPPRDPKKGVQLGKKSWAAVMEDAQLTKVPAGDPLALAKQSEDIAVLRREIERLSAENAALKTGGAGSASEQQKAADAVVRRSKREE